LHRFSAVGRVVAAAMRRHEIPAELKSAKQHLVARFLTNRDAVVRRALWAVSAHPTLNVVGVGVGRKITKGRLTARPCVRIYVEHKVDHAVVPRDFLLPSSIGDVETDIIETGPLRALGRAPAGRGRLRPVRPGCSIGFRFADDESGDLMAGTLGAIVEADGARYLLSNNHVLANENRLPVGTPIFQPGLLDGGNATADRIATLSRFVPLATDGANAVDCALAAVDDPDAVRATVLPRIGRIAGGDPVDAALDMRVEKTGRATGYTTGTVRDVSATVTVQFDLGRLVFEDQVLINGDGGQFCDGGDSGSLVVDRESGRATGLLFGGGRELGIANHLDDVLTRLGVTLVV
jgi:S1-C subfamily serine protease